MCVLSTKKLLHILSVLEKRPKTSQSDIRSVQDINIVSTPLLSAEGKGRRGGGWTYYQIFKKDGGGEGAWQDLNF